MENPVREASDRAKELYLTLEQQKTSRERLDAFKGFVDAYCTDDFRNYLANFGKAVGLIPRDKVDKGFYDLLSGAPQAVFSESGIVIHSFGSSEFKSSLVSLIMKMDLVCTLEKSVDALHAQAA